MDSWKLTLADGIVSYSKSGSKEVRIVCKDNATGKQVVQALQTGMSSLCSGYKGISLNNDDNWYFAFLDPLTTLIAQGLESDYKEFFVQTEGSWARDELMENLQSVIKEVNDYMNNSASLQPEKLDKGWLDDNGSLLVVVLIVVAVIVWALWK